MVSSILLLPLLLHQSFQYGLKKHEDIPFQGRFTFPMGNIESFSKTANTCISCIQHKGIKTQKTEQSTSHWKTGTFQREHFDWSIAFKFAHHSFLSSWWRLFPISHNCAYSFRGKERYLCQNILLRSSASWKLMECSEAILQSKFISLKK